MCFTGDTLLPTSLGIMRFDEVHDFFVGDRIGWKDVSEKSLYIATRRGPRKVSAMFKAFGPVYVLETETGETLKCVEDHPILTLVNGRSLFRPVVLLDQGSYLGKPIATELYADNPLPIPDSWSQFFSKTKVSNFWQEILGRTHLSIKAVGQMSRGAQVSFVRSLLTSNASKCPVSSYAGLVLTDINQAYFLKAILQNMGVHTRLNIHSLRLTLEPRSYSVINDILGPGWMREEPRTDDIPCIGPFREYVRRLSIICGRNRLQRWALVDSIPNARHTYRYASEKVSRSVLEGILNVHKNTSIEDIVEAELAEYQHVLTQVALCTWTRLTRCEFRDEIEATFDLRVEGYPEYTANGLIVQ